MEPKYDNAKKLYKGRAEDGKEVHSIRMIGSSTGALCCLASGQIDIFQYVIIFLRYRLHGTDYVYLAGS